MRSKRGPRNTVHQKADEDRVELIHTACTCNFPLVARIDNAKPDEPVQFFLRPTHANEKPSISLSKCRNCRRELPKLTPSEFKETLGLYL